MGQVSIVVPIKNIGAVHQGLGANGDTYSLFF
jgi:hypothetical protein